MSVPVLRTSVARLLAMCDRGELLAHELDDAVRLVIETTRQRAAEKHKTKKRELAFDAAIEAEKIARSILEDHRKRCEDCRN